MMANLLKSILVAGLALGSSVVASTIPPHGVANYPPCPPFRKGTFSINQFQLYPENADWDTKRCIVYYG